MSDSLNDLLQRQTPTTQRPLLGVTVLMVEDSRFASDAIRMMCLSSGARIRRADTLKAARRHLAIYRPTVAIIDMGLPDGSGGELIAELARAPGAPVILATSGDPACREEAAALGADGFIEKPIHSLAAFQQIILQNLPMEARPVGPRGITNDTVYPDDIALKEDLEQIAHLLEGPDGMNDLNYIAQFASGLALLANDTTLREATCALKESIGTANAPQQARHLHEIVAARVTKGSRI